MLKFLALLAFLLAVPASAAGTGDGASRMPTYQGIGTKGNFVTYGQYGIYLSPNNVAGLNLGTDYSQSATIAPNVFPGASTLMWKYPSTPPAGVYGYMFLSWGDYYNTAVQQPVTPVQVKDISVLTSSHNMAFRGASTDYNVIDDSYLLTTPGDHLTHKYEVAVVWRCGNATAQSFFTGFTNIGTVVISGVTWTARVRLVSTPPLYNVGFIVFYAAGFPDMPVGSFDYATAFTYLRAQGYLDGNEWMGGISLGAEPIVNEGALTFYSFNVTAR
jgi:hypothetical protein